MHLTGSQHLRILHGVADIKRVLDLKQTCSASLITNCALHLCMDANSPKSTIKKNKIRIKNSLKTLQIGKSFEECEK